MFHRVLHEKLWVHLGVLEVSVKLIIPDLQLTIGLGYTYFVKYYNMYFLNFRNR